MIKEEKEERTQKNILDYIRKVSRQRNFQQTLNDYRLRDSKFR
jgi:hypothetical protein